MHNHHSILGAITPKRNARAWLALLLMAAMMLSSLGAPRLAHAAEDAELVASLGLSPSAVSSLSTGTSDPKGFNAFTTAASGFPGTGSSYFVMSTGCTSLALNANTSTATTCYLGGLNTSQGRDMVQMAVTLNVPTQAKSWAVDWKFFSEEYPEYVGTAYNDVFLIETGSSNFTLSGNTVTAPNNVAYDANDKNITINTTGALGMTAADAAGTTYDGATKRLTTAANVPAGATSLKLIFSVMDLGDDDLDTTVFLNNLRFSTNNVGEPETKPSEICGNNIDDDKDGSVDEDCIQNQAPTASAGGPYAVNEGTSVTLNGTGTDPDADDTLSYLWSPAANLNDATLEDPTYTGVDDATDTLTLTVTDSQGATDSSQATVTVNNVAPTASAGAFTLNPLTGSAKASFDYSDAGSLDTHTASSFNWSIDSAPRSATITNAENVAPFATGSASDTRTLAANCYNLTVTGTATDDDGGSSDPLSIAANKQVDVYTAGFKSPIQDNARNIAKYGNVVPVKVSIVSSCSGLAVTDETLHITLAKGTGNEAIEESSLVAESVSAADSGTQMRTADSMYIYNLATKSMTANTDYTIRVRQGSTTGPIILQAVLFPKK